jgi:hypothetical protein
VIHSSGFPATRGRIVPLPRAKDPSGSVVGKIVDSDKDIRGEIIGGWTPSTTETLRPLSNIRLTPRRGYLQTVGRKKERTLAVSTARTFAQTLRRVALFTPDGLGTHLHHGQASASDAVRFAVHEHVDRDLS